MSAASWKPEEGEPAETQRAVSLLIPLNPHCSPDVDPAQHLSTEYVNPVVVNNREVLYTNAAIQLTDQLNAFNTKIEAAKKAKRDAEEQLAAFERRILRQHPLPRGTTTLKAIDAYIERMAVEGGTADQLDELRTHLRDVEDALAHWERRRDNARNWLAALELGSKNITTFLSFVKYAASV